MNNKCVSVNGIGVVGHITKTGLIEFLPEYSKLLNLLYEFGPLTIQGPEQPGQITSFYLPETTKSIFNGTSDGVGFAKFVQTPGDLDSYGDNDFYTVDQEHTLNTIYSNLITKVSWSSDIDVTIMFMSAPSGVLDTNAYYDPNCVYPIASLDNKLAIQKGLNGVLHIQDYSDSIYVYVSGKCNITITMDFINPVQRFIPDLKVGVPLTEYLDDKEEVPVTYSVLLESGSINYQPYSKFKHVAKLVKSTVESYSKPNPFVVSSNEPLLQESMPLDKVLIFQNITLKSYGFDLYWSGVRTLMDVMKNQYNNDSPYGKSEYSIGGFNSLYTSTHYPVLYCTLCIPSTSNMITTPINISLSTDSTTGWKDLSDASNTPLLYKNVMPISSYNLDYKIYTVRFDMTKSKESYGNFCIKITRSAEGFLDMRATWKLKMLFYPRLSKLPEQKQWDPFMEHIYIPTSSGSYTAPYEYTVARALIVGAGGGGAGSFSNSGNEYSGGGGGRGSTYLTDNLKVSDVDNSYRSGPVSYVIGKGGEKGLNGGMGESVGGTGGASSITYATGKVSGKYTSTTIEMKGGEGGSTVNGGNSGGGAGSVTSSTTLQSGEPGNRGRGEAGAPTINLKGGKGGDGPIITFPGITRGIGYPGSVSSSPAGGGAGCLAVGDVNVGSGGNGSDFTKGDSVKDGNPGYIAIAYRYVYY
jgi:hypothetical protein